MDEIHAPIGGDARGEQLVEDGAIEDKGAVNMPTLRQRRRQSGVICQAQVATKPYQPSRVLQAVSHRAIAAQKV